MATTPEVHTYDPKKVTVSVAGRAITGFASDGVVTVTHNEDIVTPSVGAKGDVAYSENANNTGQAVIPLMSTSASLAYLRQLCTKRQQVRFDVADANNDAAIHISEERCRILKVPDTPRTREQTTVNVTVYIPDLNYR
jgi:hypothetical protein